MYNLKNSFPHYLTRLQLCEVHRSGQDRLGYAMVATPPPGPRNFGSLTQQTFPVPVAGLLWVSCDSASCHFSLRNPHRQNSLCLEYCLSPRKREKRGQRCHFPLHFTGQNKSYSQAQWPSESHVETSTQLERSPEFRGEVRDRGLHLKSVG